MNLRVELSHEASFKFEAFQAPILKDASGGNSTLTLDYAGATSTRSLSASALTKTLSWTLKRPQPSEALKPQGSLRKDASTAAPDELSGPIFEGSPHASFNVGAFLAPN